MPNTRSNNIELHYDETGTGEPLILVHGGWSDLHNWDPVVPGLAEHFRVVAYDRRGHGGSSREPVGTRRDQEDDLAGLIEALGGGPAHVAGTSFGGSIALGLAARRPELVRSVVAHEPPLMALVAEDPEVQPLLAPVGASIQSVTARVVAGDAEGAARQFVNEVALGEGAWDLLPPPLRATMVDGAEAFVGEQGDPRWAALDRADRVRCPVLVTEGDQSPPWFAGIVAKLVALIDTAELRTYAGAGHAPHLTHPGDYLATVTGFLAGLDEGRRGDQADDLVEVVGHV